jgi:uncharacterized peroxidase-related enzyme
MLIKLETIEEPDATGEIAGIYAEIQRALGTPFVPIVNRILANAPNTLHGSWRAFDQIFLNSSLPISLGSMILYSISSSNKCEYCAPVFRAACMSAGIDDQTLAALDGNLSDLSPMRVRSIVEFAQKCARDRADLSEADYEKLRVEGVTEKEILEIIALAALGNFLNTFTDSLKLQAEKGYARTQAA